MPTSGRLREVRVSRTVVLPLRTSPGLTGCCHFSVSTPGEPKELESSRSPSQNMRMNSAQTCQPDAIRLPISAGTAASTWKGRGSNSRAKAITSASVMARAGSGINIAGGEIFEETLGHPGNAERRVNEVGPGSPSGDGN